MKTALTNRIGPIIACGTPEDAYFQSEETAVDRYSVPIQCSKGLRIPEYFNLYRSFSCDTQLKAFSISR